MKDKSVQKISDYIKGFWETAVDRLVESAPMKGGNTRSHILEAKKPGEGRRMLAVRGSTIRVELWMPRYWQYLDEGVKGVGPAKQGHTLKPNTGRFRYGLKKIPIHDDEAKYPEEQKLLRWMKNAEVAPRNYKELKKLPIGSKKREKAFESFAWAISESIRVHGTARTDFYSKVINEGLLEKFEKELLDLAGQEVMVTITDGFK